MIQRLLSAAGLVLLLAGCATAPPAAAPASDEPTRLADEYVREFMARFPENAELSGLKVERHDGLGDNSLAAVAEWQAFEDRLAGRLDTLPFARAAVERARPGVARLFTRMPDATMTVEPYAEMLERTAARAGRARARAPFRPARLPRRRARHRRHHPAHAAPEGRELDPPHETSLTAAA